MLCESLAIAGYLAELFAAAGLWPRAPAARSVAPAVNNEMHAGCSALRLLLPLGICARHPKRDCDETVTADIERIVDIGLNCCTRFGASDVVSYRNTVWAWPALQGWIEALASEACVIETL